MLLLLLLGGVLLVSDCVYRARAEAQLEARLSRELPWGTSLTDAEAWFAARHIKYTAGDDGERRWMYALLPNDSLLSSEEMLIELEFGTDGALRTRNIRRLTYDL